MTWSTATNYHLQHNNTEYMIKIYHDLSRKLFKPNNKTNLYASKYCLFTNFSLFKIIPIQTLPKIRNKMLLLSQI